MNKKDAQVVIRRVKKIQAAGHHGGAWKVAYADFVTAMMAFFLVMWLVGSTTNKEKAAVSEYFKNPSAFKGHSASPASGPNGPGGASTSMIKLGGAMETPHERTKDQDTNPSAGRNEKPGTAAEKAADEAVAREVEKRKLESLMDEMKAAIEKSQALAPFKDQLLLDITPLGLRIQVVDKQNRPMFAIGSAALQPYTVQILNELAKYLNEVPNKISISGHTDVTPYVSQDGYSNWELSTDRANSARRALVGGGMQEGRVALVVGLASAALFDKQNPTNPVNRRISIVVMNKDAESAELGEESQPLNGTAATAAAPTSGVATPPAVAAPVTIPALAPATTPPASKPPAAAPVTVPAKTGAGTPAAVSPAPASDQVTAPPIPRIVPIPSLAAAAAARAAAAAKTAPAPASPPAAGAKPGVANPPPTTFPQHH